MVLLLWFVIGLIIGSKIGFGFFLGVVCLLICFFQRTIYFSDKGPLMATAIALMAVEKEDALVKA